MEALFEFFIWLMSIMGLENGRQREKGKPAAALGEKEAF